MYRTSVIVLICLSVVANAQKDNHFVEGRNTIVHLFEWRWDDIADECERFLSKQGYAGVQTSPPNENLVIPDYGRPWWERYQPVSYILNTRSGDENAFASMVRRCNAVGVRIYIDAVINHMTGFSGVGTAGNNADHEGELYPAVPYGPNDFHSPCNIDTWQDSDIVRNCEMNALRDLDQASEYVRSEIVAFFDHLVDLGVAGFRMDAAKLMYPEDLGAIYAAVKNLNTDHGFPENSRPFFYQEVIDMGDEPITAGEYTGIGRVLEFRYGAHLGTVFQGGNLLSNLDNWGQPGAWELLDGGDAVVFIDNHDNQRTGGDGILTYKNSKPYKTAIAFMLAHPYEATTRIISSFYFDTNDQGPPQDGNGNLVGPGINPDNTCTNGYVCEHRWSEIYNMVGFRNAVAGTGLEGWWSNGDQQIAFSRGNKGFVAFTQGGDINQTIQTRLPGGTYCDVISGAVENGACTGKSVTVGEDGNAQISLSVNDYDGVLAIHVNAKI